jgi:diguanylate cyclase (GGDEF)-like protein
VDVRRFPGGGPTVWGHGLARLARRPMSDPPRPANDPGAPLPESGPVRVLLVEDDQVDRRALRRALLTTGLRIAVDEATSGREALARLRQGRFDCVLVDHHLPDLAGTDLIAAARACHDPVFIVITGAGSERVAVEAMRHGAGDYLSKDELEPAELRRAITAALNLGAARRAQRAAQAKLQHLALHDSLTGLPNRMLFEHLLDKAVRAARAAGRLLAIAQLDLDGFKRINDSHGHAAGDQVLQAAARRLQANLRACDVAARLGGDEFALIVGEVADPAELPPVFERVGRALGADVTVNGAAIASSASIGVSVYPADGVDPPRLLAHADLALYRAKAERPGTVRFFSTDMRVALDARRSLERDLARALAADEFQVLYQPQVLLDDRSLFGLEALIRWQHPRQGLLAPDRFLPVAEQSGLILPIGTLLLDKVCRQIRTWLEHGLPRMRVAINVSPAQFRRGDLIGTIQATAGRAGIEPGHLSIELTEAALLDPDRARVMATLQGLQAIGVTVAVDDFGTGYAALNHLRDFPLDCLKIDRSVIAGLAGDQGARAMVGSVVHLSRQLDKACVAEGVETPFQIRFLQEQGARIAQGYLFARPLSAELAGRYLAEASAAGPAPAATLGQPG